MKLETPRMLIRDFAPEDAEGLQEILGDAETMEYCEPPYGLEQTRRFLNDFCIGRNGGVAAVGKEYGLLIGYILFHEYTDGVYEMGWFFNRRYWRQGYAFEACRAVLDHAFAALHAHKVFAETIDPARSVPLMEKLGMRLEGVQRNQSRDNHGNRADLYLYGLLADEWKGNEDTERWDRYV